MSSLYLFLQIFIPVISTYPCKYYLLLLSRCHQSIYLDQVLKGVDVLYIHKAVWMRCHFGCPFCPYKNCAVVVDHLVSSSSVLTFMSASPHPWENFHFSTRAFSSAAVKYILDPRARLHLGCCRS